MFQLKHNEICVYNFLKSSNQQQNDLFLILCLAISDGKLFFQAKASVEVNEPWLRPVDVIPVLHRFVNVLLKVFVLKDSSFTHS